MNPIQLGVNIDHAATLRQARRTPYPDLAQIAGLCEHAGAHSITIHLREDRRHIQTADVYTLRKTLKTHMNLEMANNPDVLAIALETAPREVCLVPERREELTTEGGLDAASQIATLAPTIRALTQNGTRVSLFIDPDPAQIHAAVHLRASCIELHTGAYALAAGAEQHAELQRIVAAAQEAHRLGLQVNAGHGLTAQNVKPLLAIPSLHTLNIGHSIIARALATGIQAAVAEMLAAIRR